MGCGSSVPANEPSKSKKDVPADPTRENEASKSDNKPAADKAVVDKSGDKKQAAADGKGEALAIANFAAPELDLSPFDVFSELDKDNGGTLSVEEFRSGLLAKNAKADDVEALFKECDTSKDGQLTMIEFSKGYKKYKKTVKDSPPKPNADTAALPKADKNFIGPLWCEQMDMSPFTVFSEIDKDDGGTLSLEEFKKGLTEKCSWYKVMNDDEVEAFFKQMDTSKDGNLSMLEFSKGYKKFKGMV